MRTYASRWIWIVLLSGVAALGLLLAILFRSDGDGAQPQRSRSAPSSSAAEIPLEPSAPAPRRSGVPVPVPDPPSAPPVETPAVRTRLLVQGGVTDEHGGEVETYLVTVRDPSSDPRAEPEAHGRGGKTYDVPLARTGAFRVRCEAIGFLTQEKDVTVTAEVPAATADFMLNPAPKVAIRFLTRAGERIATMGVAGFEGATLAAVATRERPGPRVVRAELWGQSENAAAILSRFGLTGTPRTAEEIAASPYDCVLDLHEPPPLIVSAVKGDLVLASESLPALVESLDVVVDIDRARRDLAAVTLRVVDAESGAPIRGASVRLVAVAREGRRATATSSEGAAMLADLIPGRHLIYVDADGRERRLGRLSLEGGKTLDLGTIPLAREASVAGQVFDPQGEAVVSFQLRAIRHCDRRSSFNAEPESLHVDGGQGGKFLADLGRGRHRLIVTTDAWAVSDTEVDTTAGSLEDVRIVLQRGTPVTVVVSGEDDWKWHARIARQDGIDFAFVGLRADASTVRLLPGEYLAHLHHEDRGLASTPFTVGDAPVTVELKP